MRTRLRSYFTVSDAPILHMCVAAVVRCRSSLKASLSRKVDGSWAAAPPVRAGPMSGRLICHAQRLAAVLVQALAERSGLEGELRSVSQSARPATSHLGEVNVAAVLLPQECRHNHGHQVSA